jgi:hypothetical protein
MKVDIRTSALSSLNFNKVLIAKCCDQEIMGRTLDNCFPPDDSISLAKLILAANQ